ncbi:MAG: uracil permease [Mogibacterium sp.]|nr:uracil permease [Mogibacterium sp.]MBR2540797.1 uracil permease [Mogibacterium sp.]
MSKQRKIIGIQERVPLGKGIPLSIQHTFAMFSASVLVPYILGISPSIALLMNGIGTLIFIFVTKGKAPAYLGSSFAFISPALLVIGTEGLGYRYALGGFVVTGLLMCCIAILIKFVGTKWIDVVLPPAAMGPVVALIGLELAGSAAQTAGILGDDGAMVADVDPKVVIVFLVTLLLAIFGGVLYRGFASAIAILISIIAGYVLALAFGLVDFSSIGEASVFELPAFQTPQWSVQAIAIIIPATLVVVSEHIGHQVVTSEVVGKDLLTDPGLHRSMFADGFSTALSGFCGSCPTTTYGENIGVMAITKVYSVWVIGGAAVFSIFLSFIGKASALIQTIPGPVMGGVSFLLYGMIGASGIRLMVDAKIDYSKARNLAMTSVVFVVGLSGIAIQIGQCQLKGMSLAAITGMVLGLVMYLLDKFKLTNEYEDDASAEDFETEAADI